MKLSTTLLLALFLVPHVACSDAAEETDDAESEGAITSRYEYGQWEWSLGVQGNYSCTKSVVVDTESAEGMVTAGAKPIHPPADAAWQKGKQAGTPDLQFQREGDKWTTTLSSPIADATDIDGEGTVSNSGEFSVEGSQPGGCASDACLTTYYRLKGRLLNRRIEQSDKLEFVWTPSSYEVVEVRQLNAGGYRWSALRMVGTTQPFRFGGCRR